MPDLYGVNERNPLPAGFHDEPSEESVDWTDSRLARIERLRLLKRATDAGRSIGQIASLGQSTGPKRCLALFADAQYIVQGRQTSDAFAQALLVAQAIGLRKGRPIIPQIIEHAKAAGVYAKRLGILDAISTLN